MTQPRLVASLSLALVAVLAACACGPKSGASAGPAPDPGPGPGGPSGDDVGTVDVSKLGAPCGDNDRCDGGTSCTKYYGIAGPSGPEFSSCEIACPNGKGACPSGSGCVTIADGPGSVCRASETVEEQPEG